MASNWDRFIERTLDDDPALTLDEFRLALAIARQTLGFSRVSGPIGRDLLMRTAGMSDVRSFTRARTVTPSGSGP